MRLPHTIAIILLAPTFVVAMLAADAGAQTRVRRDYRVSPDQVRPAQVQRPTQTQRVQTQPIQSNAAMSQPTTARTTPERPSIIRDKIPESALLTERGTDLAYRLRVLRYSEARMGEKHPSYEAVQNEIKDIKRELTAWTADEDWVSSESEDKRSVIERLPSMNERDMKQLVIQLVGKIGQLEDRVADLEESKGR